MIRVKSRLKACQDAKEQIVAKNYVRVLVKDDCTTVYGLGIGFGGKDCVIESLGNLVNP